MKKGLLVLVLVVLSFSVPAGQAGATAVLGINDGVNPVILITDGSGGDSNLTPGAITYIGSVGNWVVNVTTGLTKPVVGSATSPRMDLNSVNVSSGTGGTLYLAITDDGFSYQGGLTMSTGGTTTGSVSFYTQIGNAQFAFNEFQVGLGPFLPTAFSGARTDLVDLSSGDWLTTVAAITHNGVGTTSFDTFVQPIPEPGTMLLLGSGLVGLAGWGRKKFRK